MASALPSFASTKETTNYARLSRLLVDVGSQALRDTFDSIHPPATLHGVLARHPEHTTLQSLHTGRRKVINPTQWGKLYPTIPSSVSSAGFDITLLMILLRCICGLHPPATGWDSLPPPADTSKEANIARVKYYRNTVYGHASQASVDDATFNTYWQDISTALVGLGGTSYGTAINKLKTECMDPDMEEHYRELLNQWKKDEDIIKDKLEDIEDLLKECKEENSSIKDKLGEMEDNIRSHIDKRLENFIAQSERHSSKGKGRFCEQEGKESYNQRTETYIPGYVVKFVNIRDHKRGFRQQAWTRKRKKRLKKMTQKAERQPGESDGLGELTEDEKQQAEEITHEDERQPGGNEEFSDLTEPEKQEAEKLKELQGKTERVIAKVKDTTSSLCAVADKLDKIHKRCNIARVSGCSAGILGGILTVGGGVAVILTVGAAKPLFEVGIGVGAAGVGTNLTASIVESFIISTEIQKAKNYLKETFECIKDVQDIIQLWLDKKEKENPSYIYFLVKLTQDLSDLVVKILEELVSLALGSSDDIVEAMGKTALKVVNCVVQAADGVDELGSKASVIVVHAAFLVFDAIDLDTTGRILFENKQSDAARLLRQKADELEKVIFNIAGKHLSVPFPSMTHKEIPGKQEKSASFPSHEDYVPVRDAILV